jgi:hypothetical protein
MSEAELQTFLLRVALPPVRFGLYVKRFTARLKRFTAHRDRSAVAAIRDELRRAERLRERLARQGWWN